MSGLQKHRYCFPEKADHIKGEARPKLFRPFVGAELSREIRPIKMCYLTSSFRAHEQQSSEVSLLKIPPLTKPVIFFPVEISFVS